MTQAESAYLAVRANWQKELKFLLTPYISTRLYVYFNNRDLNKRKKTFYANEHRVTYSQCMKGLVPNITLNKLAGYNALIGMVENIRGKYTTAKIYMRPPGSQSFDITLREYDRHGELVPRITKPGEILAPDPPFTEDECQVLYYYTKDNGLIVTETDPNSEDFKKLITDSLKI